MQHPEDLLDACTGFDRDEGNVDKNRESHGVASAEAEEVFFNEPLLVGHDMRHSAVENRYYALGRTNGGRCLFVAFTVRRSLVRVISVRDMSRKERSVYARHEEEANS